MNSAIYRQADSRWGSLPYPTKNYSFAHNGCGCCSCTHNIIEIPKYAKYTPANVRPYMVQQGFATQGHGTKWVGITKTLEHYGFKVSNPNINSSMKSAWELLNKSGAPKQGVLLFRKGTRGGVRWTDGGHYVAFLNYKVSGGKHYFYTKDSGGRHHDGWYCYETTMKGLLPQIWIITAVPKTETKKTETKPAATTTTTTTTAKTTTQTYTGALPTKTIKKGSKGEQVVKWQNFLKWMGYDLKADGDFGKITFAKTKEAQKKLGFTGKAVDGIVGPNTIKKAKAYKKTVSTTSTAQKKTEVKSDTGDLPKKCIDVSYWQGKISVDNWKKIRKSCGYAICRASYTSQSKFSLSQDSTFETNYKNAMAAGLKVGAYHYSQAITVAEAKKEAEYMCNILKKYSKPTFYVVCDFEYGGRLNSKIGKKASDIANAFCDVVKAHGYSPCIYANTSTLNSNLTNPKYPVWVAQYASSCTYKGKKVMWQYTSSGRVDGINASTTNNKSAKVDLSHVYEVPPIRSTITNAQKLTNKMKELAWAYGTSKSKYDYKTGAPTTACKKAMTKYGYDTKAELSDCGNFVTTVVREAGISKSFKALHGEKTAFPTKEDDFNIVLSGKAIPNGFLKAGDIIRYKKTNGHQHAMFYFGDGKVCDAGHYDRFGNIRADEKRYASDVVKKSTIQVLRVK